MYLIIYVHDYYFGSYVSCGLSLLVLFSAPRGFSPGYSGFPLSSKTNI